MSTTLAEDRLLQAKERRVRDTGVPCLLRHGDNWVVVYRTSNRKTQFFITPHLHQAQDYCTRRRIEHYEHETRAAEARLQQDLSLIVVNSSRREELLVVTDNPDRAECFIREYSVPRALIVTPENWEEVIGKLGKARGIYVVGDPVFPQWAEGVFRRLLRPARGPMEPELKRKIKNLCTKGN